MELLLTNTIGIVKDRHLQKKFICEMYFSYHAVREIKKKILVS
jgi:hypothetical protein